MTKQIEIDQANATELLNKIDSLNAELSHKQILLIEKTGKEDELEK